MDVQYLFGFPLASETRDLFSTEERTLTLQIMNYMANFIKSGYLSSTVSVVFLKVFFLRLSETDYQRILGRT